MLFASVAVLFVCETDLQPSWFLFLLYTIKGGIVEPKVFVVYSHRLIWDSFWGSMVPYGLLVIISVHILILINTVFFCVKHALRLLIDIKLLLCETKSH